MDKQEPQKVQLTEEKETRKLAERYHIPYIDLTTAAINRELVQSFPPDFLYRSNFIPIEMDESILKIAIAGFA